jgi:predicted Zn-dependent protease
MYDFDFPASQEILSRYIAQHPEDPLPYAFRGSAYLFYELDRMNVLASEFFTDDDRIADKKKKIEPDPVIREKFLKAVSDTEARADAVLKGNPNDCQALFAMSIAQGVSTDYMAFVEKRQIASLSLAKRSNSYAQRLLRLDPKFYDAYLTAGISEYMLGSLPFFIRWFVHFENVQGDKKRAVERLELVAREGHYFKPFSKILLATIALREKRPRDAQRFLQALTQEYPANPLFRKELDKITVKIGSSDEN